MKGRCVYFFRENGSNFVKIGYTDKSISSIFSDFKMYAPLGAYIVGFIESLKARKLVREIHERYKHKRKGAEFFELTDRECKAIISEYWNEYDSLINELMHLMRSHGISIEELKMSIRLKRRKIKEDENYIKVVKEAVDEFPDSSFTSTELTNFIIDRYDFEINSIRVGKSLRFLGYHSKSTRVNGEPRKVYSK